MKASLAPFARALGLEALDGPLVIAEISGNHGGCLERAKALVQAAKASGAHAVKLQTYTADQMTLNLDLPAFQVGNALWGGRSLHALYCEAATPLEWHAPLFALGREIGIPVFSSPFHADGVAFLEQLDAPIYKIASCELVDIGLIQRVAATGKPMILSTGMAQMPEIEEAVAAARAAGAEAVALLHCNAGYPTPVADANLATMTALQQHFDVPIGLSDHSTGDTVAIAATALGAQLIEKHFFLDDGEDVVDGAFSMSPPAFKAMTDAVRDTASALGSVVFGPSESEADTYRFRRSLYVVADMAAGDRFTADKVRSIRPSGGLHTRYLDHVIGRTAMADIKAGTALDWAHVSGGKTLEEQE